MKISVIIPSFNSSKDISRAVDSFLSQDYDNKELVIIDGKSTDGTHNIIKTYIEKHPQTIKWIQEKDTGISHARNIAVKYVTGDMVGFLGADDILHKDFFNEMAYYYSVNPWCKIMCFSCYGIGKTLAGFNGIEVHPVNKRNLMKYPPIVTGEAFYYKKEIFDKFEFNENNKYTMDYEFNMALASSKPERYNFYCVDTPAIFNINDGTNISSNLSKKQRAETVAVQWKYAYSFNEYKRIIQYRFRFILKNFKMIISEYKRIK